MCMTSTKFALMYDKEEKELIGVGYKTMDKYTAVRYKTKKWHKCKGNSRRPSCFDKSRPAVSDDNKKYMPGFHLFLTQEDAENYWMRFYNSVYKFKFRGVLAFGNDMIKNGRGRPCVIAREIKMIGEV